MIPFGGSRAPYDPFANTWRTLRRALCYVLIGGTLMLILAAIVRPGCALPPALPIAQRVAHICSVLGRGARCQPVVRDVRPFLVLSDELNYAVYTAAGEFVGAWPIADGTPIDPTLLTEDVVRWALLYQMGNEELQLRLRFLFDCPLLQNAHEPGVAFISDVLSWRRGVTTVAVTCAS